MKNPKEADSYKTILKPTGEVLYKDRNSKFYGYAFPLKSQNDVDQYLEALKGIHPKASHLCYAWQVGVNEPGYRVHDDGEPNYSAGMPIYGQIQSFGLTNVLVAVQRIYGGTKLGIGGLIKAYRETSKLALEKAEVVVKTLKKELIVSCDYSQLDPILKLINKHQIELVQQELAQRCTLHLAVRLNMADSIISLLKNTYGLSVRLK